jgi:hypothetical protein
MSRKFVQPFIRTVCREVIAQYNSRFTLAPDKGVIGNDGRDHNFISAPVKNVLPGMGLTRDLLCEIGTVARAHLKDPCQGWSAETRREQYASSAAAIQQVNV